jgi:hypothetical protein
MSYSGCLGLECLGGLGGLGGLSNLVVSICLLYLSPFVVLSILAYLVKFRYF